jgi:hypothetical protein
MLLFSGLLPLQPSLVLIRGRGPGRLRAAFRIVATGWFSRDHRSWSRRRERLRRACCSSLDGGGESTDFMAFPGAGGPPGRRSAARHVQSTEAWTIAAPGTGHLGHPSYLIGLRPFPSPRLDGPITNRGAPLIESNGQRDQVNGPVGSGRMAMQRHVPCSVSWPHDASADLSSRTRRSAVIRGPIRGRQVIDGRARPASDAGGAVLQCCTRSLAPGRCAACWRPSMRSVLN